MKGFVIFQLLFYCILKNTEDCIKTPCGILVNCMGILFYDLQDSGTILRDRQAWINNLFPPDLLDSVMKMPGVK